MEDDQGNNDHAQEGRIEDQVSTLQPIREQYFIGSFEPDLQSNSVVECSSSGGREDLNLHNAISPSIHRFLQLPQVVVQGRQRRSREESLVDYSKSIMLTSE